MKEAQHFFFPVNGQFWWTIWGFLWCLLNWVLALHTMLYHYFCSSGTKGRRIVLWLLPLLLLLFAYDSTRTPNSNRAGCWQGRWQHWKGLHCTWDNRMKLGYSCLYCFKVCGDVLSLNFVRQVCFGGRFISCAPFLHVLDIFGVESGLSSLRKAKNLQFRHEKTFRCDTVSFLAVNGIRAAAFHYIKKFAPRRF